MYSFDAGGNPVPGYSCKKIEIDGTSYAKLSGFHHTTAIALDDEDIDGISDDEYDMEDDADEEGSPGHGKPDWWCRKYPNKC